QCPSRQSLLDRATSIDVDGQALAKLSFKIVLEHAPITRQQTRSARAGAHGAPTGANAHAETPGSADSRRQGYPLSEEVGGGQEGWAAPMLARWRVPMSEAREGSRVSWPPPENGNRKARRPVSTSLRENFYDEARGPVNGNPQRPRSRHSLPAW